jgi:hypothetical protein
MPNFETANLQMTLGLGNDGIWESFLSAVGKLDQAKGAVSSAALARVLSQVSRIVVGAERAGPKRKSLKITDQVGLIFRREARATRRRASAAIVGANPMASSTRIDLSKPRSEPFSGQEMTTAFARFSPTISRKRGDRSKCISHNECQRLDERTGSLHEIADHDRRGSPARFAKVLNSALFKRRSFLW